MALAMERYPRFVLLLLILVAASVHSATAARLSEDVRMARKHERWMARHGRVYKSKEEKEARLKIFKDNLKFINDYNGAQNRTIKLGLNHFGDLTVEEFKATYTTKFVNPSSNLEDYSSTTPFRYANVNVADLPPSFDWRDKGAVTPAKDQGHCGSCWSFSTTASLEGINKIKNGKLISLSEQQLLDCMGSYYGPCTGGSPANAFNYVVQNGGLASDSDYPYVEEYGAYWEGCHAAQPSARITGYENVPPFDEVSLLKAVANQPVSILFNTNLSIMQFYAGGIVTSEMCGQETNHAMAAVGYGTDESGTKYWLVKNSWSSHWGVDGYLQIQRDSGDPYICGITQGATYPVI